MYLKFVFQKTGIEELERLQIFVNKPICIQEREGGYQGKSTCQQLKLFLPSNCNVTADTQNNMTSAVRIVVQSQTGTAGDRLNGNRNK